MNRHYFFNFCIHIFFVNISLADSHDTLSNPYHLKVLNTTSEYLRQVNSSRDNEMTDIKKLIPDIKLELVYATTNNFMHQRLYPSLTTTFLRRPAALALQQVQQTLKKQGLGLQILDAYRPYGTTMKMWELVQDVRYVADPSKGSGHNRGIAVDLTIISLKTGKTLDMGTEFDNFTDSAHHGFLNLSENVLKNRNLLRKVMTENGFTEFETEWWHYFYDNGRFDILDVPFEDLVHLSIKQTANLK